MSLDGAITNLASWAGNTMMPTMAGMFFAGAVYRYSKGGQFEQLLYGGFASLMCSGMLRALEGFVQHAGATSADGFWMATMSLVNWVANVILPVFALTQLGCYGLAYGRRGCRDLSRFNLDQEVRGCNRRVDGFRNDAPGGVDGHARTWHMRRSV